MKINRTILEPQEKYSFDKTTGEALVFHTTLGWTYKGAYDTLRIRHLSYHFLIESDGTIYQLIDIDRGAWGSGVTSKMNVRARAFFGVTNPNRKAIQIAFVRKGQSEITVAQRDAGVWLTKWIGEKKNIRYNRNNTFYHREITNYNAASKPPEVKRYREQVLDGLMGFKDNKDNVNTAYMRMYLRYLKAQIQVLMLRIRISEEGA